MSRVSPVGPIPARIMLVGEAPGGEDLKVGEPFSGSSGQELTRMLHEAGIFRTECFITTVSKQRPPRNDPTLLATKVKKDAVLAGLTHSAHGMYYGDVIKLGLLELEQEIRMVRPNIIIAFGNISLWALCNHVGITSWRGSVLDGTLVPGVKVLPTYTPGMVMRNWDWRAIVVHDLRRALGEADHTELRIPPYNFLVRPTYEATMDVLSMLENRLAAGPVKLASDIETRGGLISCHGIAWSRLDAICMPHMDIQNPEGYFTAAEELGIALKTRKVLTHPNAQVIGQNYLYDAQYFAKELGYVPRLTDDTMFQQHVLFPGVQKGLDFLASMYCEFYQYWKSEGKEWNPRTMPQEQHWIYNCKDAVNTWEIDSVCLPMIERFGLTEQYRFQMHLWWNVLRMMLRGIAVDKKLRSQFSMEMLVEIAKREQERIDWIGYNLNPGSSKQMQQFFYDELQLPKQFNRKTKAVSCDDESLKKLQNKEVLIRPIVKNILEQRSLGVFNSTFVGAALDSDGRLRSSFNPAGTETYRFSSSKNAFGGGTNFENVPKGNEDDKTRTEDGLILPNIRRLFIPDPGCEIADIDQSGADAQVVAWEADDPILKELFRKGVKIHAHNAKDLYGGDAGVDGKNEPYYTRTKQGVHLSNYGGKAFTLSATIGLTIHEAEKFQRRWFEIHPWIAEWHRRIESELQTRRWVANKFGYRRFYFGRVEELLPEALAWVPQSTVACVTNRALVALDDNIGDIGMLNQVHDSLVFQYPIARRDTILRQVKTLARIVIPYDDPLVIPWVLKTSTKSWGDCEGQKWPD